MVKHISLHKFLIVVCVNEFVWIGTVGSWSRSWSWSWSWSWRKGGCHVKGPFVSATNWFRNGFEFRHLFQLSNSSATQWIPTQLDAGITAVIHAANTFDLGPSPLRFSLRLPTSFCNRLRCYRLWLFIVTDAPSERSSINFQCSSNPEMKTQPTSFPPFISQKTKKKPQPKPKQNGRENQRLLRLDKSLLHSSCFWSVGLRMPKIKRCNGI